MEHIQHPVLLFQPLIVVLVLVLAPAAPSEPQLSLEAEQKERILEYHLDLIIIITSHKSG